MSKAGKWATAHYPWPKGPMEWIEKRVRYLSVPFTWDLPKAKQDLMQRDFTWDRAVVGGPAVELMPEYLDGMGWVTIGHDMPGVLQRVNPHATRTTLGCIRKCGFCGIGCGKIEAGGFRELEDWPDLPILCDNNLLAASMDHLDKVTRRLSKWGWCDFNQGLDARLMTPEKAALLARIEKPCIRFSVDSDAEKESVLAAVEICQSAGIFKQNCRKHYVLVGFNTGPDEAWERCLWVEQRTFKANPMWFHPLDALERNSITDAQRALGWTHRDRADLQRYFYQRCGLPPGKYRDSMWGRKDQAHDGDE